MFYGDVMVVHACTDIKKGDEIFLPYIHPAVEYSVRQKSFDHWNFTCKCKLCEIDANDELCSKRHQMLEEFYDFYEKNKKYPLFVTAKGEETLKKIRETYTKRQEFKTVLALLLYELYQFAFNIAMAKSYEYVKELATLSDDFVNSAFNMPRVFCQYASFCTADGNIAKSDEMMQKALEASFGTDMEYLKMRYF